MALTNKSLETLIDLVEIRLSCIDILDNQDARTVKTLKRCRQELYDLADQIPIGDLAALQDVNAA